MTFLVCGEALWDLFASESRTGVAFEGRAGGSPFNVAIGIARLGSTVGFFGGLSKDPLGQRLAERLEAEGVGTGHFLRSPARTTLSLVDLGPDGSPAYAFYGEACADRMVREEDVPPLGDDVWGLHFGSYSVIVEPVGRALAALAGQARDRSLLLTYDPNVRLNVEPDVARWRDTVEAWVARADLVKVSSEDLELIYGDGPHEGRVAEWLQSGPALVVVTHGADGAVIHSPSNRIVVPGRAVVTVDTVGAGDSFMAAMLTALDRFDLRTGAALRAAGDAMLRQIGEIAVEAASITCARRGADLPNSADLSGA